MSIADTMPIMITQTVAMFVMMAVGIALFEFKYIDNRSAQHMASIALYVATPCVVLRSLATQSTPRSSTSQSSARCSRSRSRCSPQRYRGPSIAIASAYHNSAS